jgi:hypothetical protein
MAKIDKKDLDRAWKVIHEGLEPGAKSLARLIAEALIEARVVAKIEEAKLWKEIANQWDEELVMNQGDARLAELDREHSSIYGQRKGS